jgi:hypothetical protein
MAVVFLWEVLVEVKVSDGCLACNSFAFVSSLNPGTEVIVWPTSSVGYVCLGITELGIFASIVGVILEFSPAQDEVEALLEDSQESILLEMVVLAWAA